jgi:hypothetical protein
MSSRNSSKKRSKRQTNIKKVPEREQLLNFVSKFKDLIMSASPKDNHPPTLQPPKFHGRFVRADSKTEKEMLQSKGSRVVNYFNDSMANQSEKMSRRSRKTRSRKSGKSYVSRKYTTPVEKDISHVIDKSLGRQYL